MSDLLNESEKIEQLKKLVESLFGAQESNLLGGYFAPFDISRPNIHDSKKEFTRELATVTAVRDHLRHVLDLLIQTLSPEDRDPMQAAMIKRLSVAIETIAVHRGKDEAFDAASDLALKNIRETGFYFNSLFVVLEMHGAFDKRLRLRTH